MGHQNNRWQGLTIQMYQSTAAETLTFVKLYELRSMSRGSMTEPTPKRKSFAEGNGSAGPDCGPTGLYSDRPRWGLDEGALEDGVRIRSEARRAGRSIAQGERREPWDPGRVTGHGGYVGPEFACGERFAIGYAEPCGVDSGPGCSARLPSSWLDRHPTTETPRPVSRSSRSSSTCCYPSIERAQAFVGE
jgi:hypothetical protein